MHSLLKRQIRKHFGSETEVPAAMTEFLCSVDEAYAESDQDRHMLERALDLSSAELLDANISMRTIFQAFPDLFLRLDAEGMILDCRGGRAGGAWSPPEKALGKAIWDVPGAQIRETVLAAFAEARRSDAMVLIEFALEPAGAVEHYEARIVPATEDQFIVTIRNISDRIAAESALAAQRAFLNRVIDLNPHYVFAKDQHGRFTLANMAIADAYGTTVDGLIGKTDADFGASPDSIARNLREDLEVIRTREDFVIPEEPITFHDGSIHWIHTVKRAIPALNGHDWHVLRAATDITERHDAEQSLRRKTEQAQVQEEALHRLAFLDPTNLDDSLDRIVQVAAETLGVPRVAVWILSPDQSLLSCRCRFREGRRADRRA